METKNPMLHQIFLKLSDNLRQVVKPISNKPAVINKIQAIKIFKAKIVPVSGEEISLFPGISPHYFHASLQDSFKAFFSLLILSSYVCELGMRLS